MSAPKRFLDMADVESSLRPPERILALQAEKARISSSFKEYKRTHGQIDQLLHEVLALVPAIDVQVPVWKPSVVTTKDPCSVALHITDVHYGAYQEEDEVEGFGQYSAEISEKRQLGLIRDVIDWVNIHRHGYSLNKCNILVTGDLISGDIHDELRVTNEFPAPMQACGEAEIFAKQVAMMAPHFEQVVVDIITNDNHGRLTRKPQAKQGGTNNWMYVVASMAKVLLRDQKNVTVNIHAMSQRVVNVNGRRYLLTHGHEVMGWAGFPYYGIERKAAREALKRMNGPDVTKFDKIIMGHWHAPLEHPVYWIGGSVSGTDAYDHQAGRHARPQQVSWLVHPKWGEFDRTCWLVDKWDNVRSRG